MDIFNVLIVQPIFNALLIIYGVVGDFGLSIIIFTILVRLLLWPLIKKQLHQTKLMRKVQPELKKIKARTKGDKQLEAKLMMELYRERGIKPFSSIGVLIIQLPIFIGIYQVITIITQHKDQIESHLYEFTKQMPNVAEVLAHNEKFNETLLGVISLTQTALGGGSIHIPLVILAFIAAIFQYIQTKQLMPDAGSSKKLRDILKDASAGKEADQSDISAAMSSKMATFMPLLLLVFALFLPGAVVLYYATSSIVAVIQQHLVLRKDEEEMEVIADEKPSKKNPKAIKEATVVTKKSIKTSKKSKKNRKKR